MKQKDQKKVKASARKKVSKAINSGKLIKSPFCVECFGWKNITAHHIDYSQPLKVNWLCRDCHTKIHSWDARNRINININGNNQNKMILEVKN